jgi:hypothetical protein
MCNQIWSWQWFIPTSSSRSHSFPRSSSWLPRAESYTAFIYLTLASITIVPITRTSQTTDNFPNFTVIAHHDHADISPILTRLPIVGDVGVILLNRTKVIREFHPRRFQQIWHRSALGYLGREAITDMCGARGRTYLLNTLSPISKLMGIIQAASFTSWRSVWSTNRNAMTYICAVQWLVLFSWLSWQIEVPTVSIISGGDQSHWLCSVSCSEWGWIVWWRGTFDWKRITCQKWV